MNKILREIARPFRQLNRIRQQGSHPLPAAVAKKTPAPAAVSIAPAKAAAPAVDHAANVQFLAPTRRLGDIVRGADRAEVRMFSQLLRTHMWAMPENELVVLAAVVQTLQPRRVFEFGTFTGGSTLVIAANAAEDAHITTLDIGPLEKYKVTYEPGSLYQPTRYAQRIEQRVEDSLHLSVGALRGVMDFVFVDANHTYEYAKNDTALAFEMLRPGGVVMWHDYTWLPEHHRCVGVTHAVNEVQLEKGHCFHIEGTRFAIYIP